MHNGSQTSCRNIVASKNGFDIRVNKPLWFCYSYQSVVPSISSTSIRIPTRIFQVFVWYKVIVNIACDECEFSQDTRSSFSVILFCFTSYRGGYMTKLQNRLQVQDFCVRASGSNDQVFLNPRLSVLSLFDVPSGLIVHCHHRNGWLAEVTFLKTCDG